MAQASETKLKATIFRQQLILYLWLSVFAFIGVFLIFGAVYWKQASRENGDNVRIFQLGQSIPQGEAADNVQKFITERSEQGGLVTDLLRDLGIALVISVFVTIAIELHANRRLREHITYDVLSAAYAKVIPEKIYAQVADNVFRSNVYRRNWEVHISADSQQVDKERGIAIIKVQYSYDLENLNERKLQSYPIYGVIDLDVPLPEQDILR